MGARDGRAFTGQAPLVLARILVLVLGGFTAAGCGGGGVGTTAASAGATGGGSPGAAPVPDAVRQAMHTHEAPSPPGAPERASGGAASAATAVRDYAERYINWDASSVTAMLHDLARRSIGQARSAMALEAAQVASDPTLGQNGIANAGVVEAVAPLGDGAAKAGTSGGTAGGGTPRYVVVTRERTTATLSTAYQGLLPAWHVTVAAVAEVAPGRWVVSGWQPEN